MAESRCNNNDITREEEEEKKISQILRLWSDLPVDILREIMTSGLLLADRIRATAVCKSWLLPSPEIRSSMSCAGDQLPLIMTSQFTRTTSSGLTRREFGRNHIACQLYDSCYKKQKPYLINQDITTTDVANRNRGIDADARACTSKQGWVMFYQTREIEYWSFFLYSPFTGEIITELPDLHSIEIFDLATFSTSPTSPDCVFFILKQSSIYSLTVRTCCRGDITWNKHIFDDREIYYHYPIYKDAIYVDGSFFFVSSYGTLAAFSVARQDFTMLTIEFESLENPNIFGERVHMVECNGELLLVTINDHMLDDCSCKLFRFDKTWSAWVRKEGGLEDRALFVGECSSYSISTVGEDTLLKNIANKVFYHFSTVDRSRFQTKFCLLEDGSKSQCCEGSEIYGWVKDRKQRCWIQPPN